MSTELRHRRGTTVQHSTFAGAVGEFTMDTDKSTVVVHDGATLGGRALSREDATIIAAAKAAPVDADVLGLQDSGAGWVRKKLSWANLKTALFSGNLAFTGTGNRITGDFSNATIANRVMFQTSTVNGGTAVTAIPNGTGTSSEIRATNASDPTNSATALLGANSVDIRVVSGIYGTGTYLPMTFYTGGSERVRIDASGNVTVTSPAGLGYGTGAGGTVTQATSKATAVTLNKPTGQITMNAAALAAGATAQFNFYNSLLSATDTLVCNVILAGVAIAGSYSLRPCVSAGVAQITIKNESGGSLSESVVINFAIIKGATS